MQPFLLPEVTPPTELPVSVAEMKGHSIIDYDDDDAQVLSFVKAASSRVDGYNGILGRAVMPQDVIQKLPRFDRVLRLPYGTVLSVTGVQYYDEVGILNEFEDYTLLRDAEGDFLYLGRSHPNTYDRPDAVIVSYRAGWADADLVPDAVKQAIRLMAAHWFQFREEALVARGGNLESIPLGVSDLLAPYRRVGV